MTCGNAAARTKGKFSPSLSFCDSRGLVRIARQRRSARTRQHRRSPTARRVSRRRVPTSRAGASTRVRVGGEPVRLLVGRQHRDFASISTSRSRTALPYSTRLRRWSSAGRPGFTWMRRRDPARSRAGRDAVVGRVIQAPRPEEHRTAPELDDDLFPRIGGIGHLNAVHVVERETASLALVAQSRKR